MRRMMRGRRIGSIFGLTRLGCSFLARRGPSFAYATKGKRRVYLLRKGRSMKTVGLGIIGAGGWGGMHARTYATVEYARLYGVADADLSRAEALAKPFGAAAYGDFHA